MKRTAIPDILFGRVRLKVLDYLFPAKAEREPAFRAEIHRVSRLGLLVVGRVQIAISLFMLGARFFVAPHSGTLPFRSKQAAAVILLGLLNIAVSRVRRLAPWMRLIAALSGLVTVTITVWVSLLVLQESTNPDDFIPGQITLVMLVAVSIVPLQPIQTFAIGMAIEAIYILSTAYAERVLNVGSGPAANYVLFILMLTLLTTGISAVVYDQRRRNFELRAAQTRSLLAENAASLARLAAALSHELNNPIGALLSGVDTMLLLAAKQATCQPHEQQRLVVLQGDLRRSIQESAERLKALVSRMQRFTNLDQAEVQEANLNELVSDVAALMESQMPKTAKLELDLAQALQPVVCRPQQISAALSNLVNNAVDALNGEGRVTISTRQKDESLVEVRIQDNGRGVAPDQIPRLFDPGFKVSGDSVRAANWSLFGTRQIIREHGGDIRIVSSLGAGTTVTVTLPAGAALT